MKTKNGQALFDGVRKILESDDSGRDDHLAAFLYDMAALKRLEDKVRDMLFYQNVDEEGVGDF